MRRPGPTRARLRLLILLLGLLPIVLAACTGGGKPTPGPTPVPTLNGAPVTGQPNPLGAHWDPSNIDRYAPYLRRLAGGATFDQFEWCQVEPKQGSYNWSPVDKVIQQNTQVGMTTYLKIRIGACWATGKSLAQNQNRAASSPPKDMGAYKDFVSSVVKRYSPRGVHEYAIENEVNATSYWTGSPRDYVTLVENAASAIHAASADAKVVDDGMSSVAYGAGISDRLLESGQGAQAVAAYQRYYAERLGTRSKQQLPTVNSEQDLRAALSAGQSKANVDFLAADKDLLARHVVDIRQVHFYESWDTVPLLLDYVHAETPAGTPIEAWEVGQFQVKSPGAADTRAAQAVKAVALLLAGGVRRVIWLPLAFNENGRQNSESRYGLLDPSGAVRDSGQQLLEIATLASRASLQAVTRGTLQGVSFAKGGHTTLIVWSTQGSLSVRADKGTSSAAVGSALKAASSSVSIGATPVMIQVTKPLAQVLDTVH